MQGVQPLTDFLMLCMEMYSKNGDYKTKSELSSQDCNRSLINERKKTEPSNYPLNNILSSTLPSHKGLAKCNSTPAFHQDFSEFTFPLVRKVPEKPDRQTFLHATEHILATFYGLVFEIEGSVWNILKSDYLPIHFVRVCVKNVKYPFRILVIDNDIENDRRVIDFVVNCETKASIKDDAVCWQDQEKFGAKFRNKSLAFQFYDTISRMASTLRKGKELESENQDKMQDLEVHLPNFEVKSYQFFKTDKLQDVLKFICDKEKLRVNDHYLHHMQMTDDSLDMTLKVVDIRTHRIRVISKRETERSSTNISDKVRTQSSRKKNRGIFSLFVRKYSRKAKDSRQYSSAPSIIQLTDNVFLVERQSDDQKKGEIHLSHEKSSANTDMVLKTTPLTKTSTHDGSNDRSKPATPSTLPLPYSTKRKAPKPPRLIMPKREQNLESGLTEKTNGHILNEGRKLKKKRRAPSPPKYSSLPEEIEETSNETSSTLENAPTSTSMETFTSLNLPVLSQSEIETENNFGKKKRMPVFIPPPPPDSTPPPVEECDTPIGPIDSEQDDISLGDAKKLNGDINGKVSLDCKTVSENQNVESQPKEEVKDADDNVDLADGEKKTIEEHLVKKKNEETDQQTDHISQTLDSKECEEETSKEENMKDEDVKEDNKLDNIDKDIALKLSGDEAKKNTGKEQKKVHENENKRDNIDMDLAMKSSNDKANISRQNLEEEIKNVNELASVSEHFENINPEQRKPLMMSQISGVDASQQVSVNFQNQQLLAMQQNQQMLSNLFLQQMLHQQLQAHQQPTNMIPVGAMVPSLPPGSLFPISIPRSVHPIYHSGTMSPNESIPPIQHPISGTNYGAPIWSPAHINIKPLVQPVSNPSNGIETKEIKSGSIVSQTSTDNLIKSDEKSNLSSTKASSSLPLIAEEELVNRPMFKKMLAQRSKEKQPNNSNLNQVPTANVITKLPPVSSNKIVKVPTSYVDSAEKKVPETQPKENTTPITLGEIGRKSSYVDSAIDRQKIENVDESALQEVIPTNTKSTVVDQISVKSRKSFEMHSLAKEQSKSDGKSEKLSLNTEIKQQGDLSLRKNNSSFNAEENRAENKNQNITTDLNLEENEVKEKVGIGELSPRNSSQDITPNTAGITEQQSSTSSGVNVENDLKRSPEAKTINSNKVSVVTSPRFPQTNNDFDPTKGGVISQINYGLSLNSSNTFTSSSSMNSVAREAAQVANDKRKSLDVDSTTLPPNSSSSRKLTIEEPILDKVHLPAAVPPNEDKATLATKPNTTQLPSKNMIAASSQKDRVTPYQVAEKPRYQRLMSEPKPVIAPKPAMYDNRKSKTLPKTNKPQHIKISLSLTPEERMQISKSAGLSTTAKAGGK